MRFWISSAREDPAIISSGNMRNEPCFVEDKAWENPTAKITMDKTAALSSVPGITVTPVKLENDQIFRGNSVMQLGEGGAGQLSADGLTVQTDGDGAGQYSDESQGITLQVSGESNGIFTDEQKKMMDRERQ